MGVALDVSPASRPEVSDNSGEETLDEMAALIASEGALELRIAELLYAIESGERRGTGAMSFRTLVKEFTDLDRSWAVKLKNFGAPGLVAVKVALCRNAISISDAVEAPRDMTVEEEVVWIEGVRSGERKRRRQSAHTTVDVEDPVDAAVLHESRKLARTIVGGNCSDFVADKHVREAWTTRTDGKEIIRKAIAPREPPPELPPVDWTSAFDPAAEVLGAREVPTDALHARHLLEGVLHDKRMRAIEIGRRFQEVVDDKLYRLWGFQTVESMVKKCFRVSLRTLQNYRDRARNLSIYPELMQALEQGMHGSRVQLVYEVATEDNVARWLEVAKRTTVAELERAVAWSHETVHDVVLEHYESAIRETQSAHMWVALQAAKRPTRPPKRIEGVHPDQMKAARWYLANVKLPKQYGFEQVKEREEWTCENPRCYTPTITSEGHHTVWLSCGGTNELGNGTDVCRCCHHAGIHTDGFLRLERDGKGRKLWTFADGVQVTVF